MDPFSITVGVVSLATFVLHSARRVNEFVDGIQGAPEAINIVSRDLHAFAHVLESLSTTLTGPAFRQLPARKQIELQLEEPLNNCVDTLERIREGIKPFVKTSGDARKSKWRGFIWTFNEKEISTLRETLMHYKSTLEIAISLANFSNSTSSSHQISAQIGVIRRRIEEDGDSVIEATERSSIAGTDVGFALKRWILDPTTGSAESPDMDWRVVATDFEESDDAIETKSVDQKRESARGDVQAETIEKESIDIAEDTKRLDTNRQDALRASSIATSHRLHIIQQNPIEEAKGVHSESQDAIMEGRRRGHLDTSGSSGEESAGASNQREAAVRLRMERLPEVLDKTREEQKTRGEEFYLKTAVTAWDAQNNPFHNQTRFALKNRFEPERDEPSSTPQYSQDAESNLSCQAITFSDALRDDRNAHPAPSSQYRDSEEAARQRVLSDLVLINEEHAEYRNDHSNQKRVMSEPNDNDQEDSQSPIPGQNGHWIINSMTDQTSFLADAVILKRMQYQTLRDSDFWAFTDKILSSFSEVVHRLTNIKQAHIRSLDEYRDIAMVEEMVKTFLSHHRRICQDRRWLAKQKFQEQYRFIRPDASEAEVREAFEDISSSRALLQGLQGDVLQVAQKIHLQQEDVLRIFQTLTTLDQLSQDLKDLDKLEPITLKSSALLVDHGESSRIANNQLDKAIKSARRARALKNRFLTLGVSRLFERDD